MTPPNYSTSHTASSSFQPRVIRASSSAVAASHDPISYGTRHSVSPVRHRAQSSSLLSRPQVTPRVHSTALRAQEPPFETPAYLSHVVLSNLFHGGPPPLQTHILESRVTSEAPSSMTDSDESTQGDPHIPGFRRRHRHTSPKELVSWPTILPLPTQWSESDKSPHLTVGPDGRDVSFNGTLFGGNMAYMLIYLQATVTLWIHEMLLPSALIAPYRRLAVFTTMK